MTEKSLIRFGVLYGTIPFIEPTYHIEPRLDLRERPLDWGIICDDGVSIMGFSSRAEAVLAARHAGMKLKS